MTIEIARKVEREKAVDHKKGQRAHKRFDFVLKRNVLEKMSENSSCNDSVMFNNYFLIWANKIVILQKKIDSAFDFLVLFFL